MTRYLCIISALIFTFPVQAEEKIIRIYQDADLSNHAESSMAIQKGIEVAFKETGNEIAGHKIEFEYLDHRGNVARSKQNYEKFLADPKALAIYSGIHSPPLIRNREFINKNGALTLVPWAAGGPITRHPSPENWIFRLSVDDMRAGQFMIDHAMNNKGCKNPHLLLESTSWGDSNLASMSKALLSHGVSSPGVTRFSWNTQAQAARIMLRNIISSADDCIILVANAKEGAVITQALLDIKSHIPIISHWGITGGDFHEKITNEKRKMLDLSFIQSCFAFTNDNQTAFSNATFENLKKHAKGAISAPEDLRSAVGFIHAYDLTRILIATIKQAGLSGDIAEDRNAIRLALENLQKPVEGLIKTYNAPFSTFDAQNNINAHEALHIEDYCMARYGDSDEITIIETDIE